ncbi:DUF2798 domain-containing protein [Ancylomarina longa]|uniref:DUF2798 domain-containing protein n=1 Tax=Ancylomarina longa TaxID=2487017 RepID=A0A434AWT6_9BACT|nr:DUF2798 domain-containing protein [Ancylomarina longa]RUT78978.1 DUF2798 domain-containing protein [Ancylomarina longa]
MKLKKYETIIFTLIMSLSLGLFISLIVVTILTGVENEFLLRWAKSFGMAFSIAFPTSLVLVSIAKKLTDKIVGN